MSDIVIRVKNLSKQYEIGAARSDTLRDELVDGLWLRLLPHLHRTDGFFAAVWQRKH